MSKLPPADQEEIVRLYRRGLTLRQVAGRVYWSPTAVRRVLIEYGEPLRPHGSKAPLLSMEEKLRTSELYGAGMSMAELAILLGLHVSTVHRRLHRFGSLTRPVGGKHPPPRSVDELRRLELQISRAHGTAP